MRAIILDAAARPNPGQGAQPFTAVSAHLGNGESVFHRQLRLLAVHGIVDVVVVARENYEALASEQDDGGSGTRPSVIRAEDFSAGGLAARLTEFITDDHYLLVGADVVFDSHLVRAIACDPRSSLAVADDPGVQVPLGVGIAALQRLAAMVRGEPQEDSEVAPFFKLGATDLKNLIEYALTNEGPAGEHSRNQRASAGSLARRLDRFNRGPFYLRTVSNAEDLAAAAAEIRKIDLRQHPTIIEAGAHSRIVTLLQELGVARPLIVHDGSQPSLEFTKHFEVQEHQAAWLEVGAEEPTHEQILLGSQTFRARKCDGILAVGDAGAIGAAKFVRLLAQLEPGADYRDNDVPYTPTKLVVAPAGGGVASAWARFAWVERDGVRASYAHDAMLPDLCVLDPVVLSSACDGQRRETVLAGLVQCLESALDPEAREDDRRKALQGLRILMGSMFTCLKNGGQQASLEVLRAGHFARSITSRKGPTLLAAMGKELAAQWGVSPALAMAWCCVPMLRVWNAQLPAGADIPAVARWREMVDELCRQLAVADAAAALELISRVILFLSPARPVTFGADAVATLKRMPAETWTLPSPVACQRSEILNSFEADAPPQDPLPGVGRTEEIQTLAIFADFCARYQVPYYLTGSSLRDAVVNGQLTPWTPAVSVALTRTAMARLSKFSDQLPDQVQFVEDVRSSSSPSGGARILWRMTEQRPGTQECETSSVPGIDVRILDQLSLGQSPAHRLLLAGWAILHHASVALSRPSAPRVPGMPARLGRLLARHGRASTLAAFRALLAKRGESSRGERVYVDPGAHEDFKKSMLPTRWYRSGSWEQLNGVQVRVPSHAQSVLARTYGRDHRNATRIPLTGPLRPVPPKQALQQQEPGRVAAGPELFAEGPSISIVVPVYNVEQYLAQCLDSLCQQDYASYEIVAVNDGSPDNSQAILDLYAEMYPDILRVFTKENGGLSDARNFGIQQARGEYLAFVDSDDLVHPHMLRLMGEKAAQTGADIITCRLSEFWEAESRVERRWMASINSFGSSVHERPELLVAVQPYAWNKLFRRSLFLDNGITFPKGQAFEDSATTFNLMVEANKIELVNKHLYYYRKDRADSITNTFDRRFHDIFKSFDSIRGHFQAKGCLAELHDEVNELIRRTAFARLETLESCPEDPAVDEFLDALYDYLERFAPDWAQNKYFVHQMRNPKYASHPRYRAAHSRAGAKAYFASLRSANAGGKVSLATSELLSMLQREGLEILLELDRLCREHGLTYYLAEGTLLGAVRHQGFIPWDDDVDVCMPRGDYERLGKILVSEEAGRYELELFNRRTYPRYHLSFSKVTGVRPSNFITTHLDVPSKFTGPAVDIFPLDAALKRADRRRERRARWLRDMLLFKSGYMSARTRQQRWSENLASKFLPFRYLQGRIDAIHRSHEGDEGAVRVANFASSYPSDRETFCPEWFGQARRAEFEGHLLPIPSNWDAVLRTTYGEYMELPPLAKRVPRHRPQWRA